MLTRERKNPEFLLRIIDHISDKEYQLRAWMKGEEADFDEVVCLFFDFFDYFHANLKDYNILDSQYHLLKNFKNEFEAFADDNSWPPFFIDIPEWAKIMENAKGVLKAFDYKK